MAFLVSPVSSTSFPTRSYLTLLLADICVPYAVSYTSKKEGGVIMVCTYEEYLKQSKAITFEKMQTIHTEMLAEIGADVEALELYNELMKVAARYATIRANWLLLSREEKNEQDSGRTSCHNSVITHFNMLARYLKQQGKTAAWRDELGYEEDDPYNRKAIGDFACYLAFVNGVNAR